MVKNLIDADHFSFISIKDNLCFSYQTLNDHFNSEVDLDAVLLDQIKTMNLNQVCNLGDNQVFDISPVIKLDEFSESFSIKFESHNNELILVVFHFYHSDSENTIRKFIQYLFFEKRREHIFVCERNH